MTTGELHHVELWVPDLQRATAEWGWLLAELGYAEFQAWSAGCSWRLGGTYIVVEESPDLAGERHDRRLPGMNHVAFHAGEPARVEDISARAPANGWTLLFGDRHPHAGGRDHYAAYLVNSDGFEAELVAPNARSSMHPPGPASQLRAVGRATAPHYVWGDGCDGWRLVDRPELSVIEERVPPGVAEVWHVHDVALQFFYVISGQAEMRTRAGATPLFPGVGVEVAPGVEHQFANVGDEDVVFLVTSTPSTRGDRR